MPRTQTRRKTRRRMRGGEWTLDQYKQHLQYNISQFGNLASILTTKRGIDSTKLAIMSTKIIDFQTGYTCAYLRDIITTMSTFLLNLPTSKKMSDSFKEQLIISKISQEVITQIKRVTDLFYRENNINIDANIEKELYLASSLVSRHVCYDNSISYYLRFAVTLSEMILTLNQLQPCETYKGGICPSPCTPQRILLGRNKCRTPVSFTDNVRRTPEIQPGHPAVLISAEQYEPRTVISLPKTSPFFKLRRTGKKISQAFRNATRRIGDRFRRQGNTENMDYDEEEFTDPTQQPNSEALEYEYPLTHIPLPVAPKPLLRQQTIPATTTFRPAIIPRNLTRPEIVKKDRTKKEINQLFRQLLTKWDDVIAYAAHLKSVRGISDEDLQMNGQH